MTVNEQHIPTDQVDENWMPIAVSGVDAQSGVSVPVTVWRLDDGEAAGNGFESRLAHRLVQTYSSPGQAVVDFDADPNLRDAASAASRSYVPLGEPSQVADLDDVVAPVSLVVLRWPRLASSRTGGSVSDLFRACRLIMSAETSAIAAVSSAEPGRPGTTYSGHLAELQPAARSAGLTHVLEIVAIGGAGNGDEFLYYATLAEAEHARATKQSGGTPALHVDLMVFSTSQQRHA